jgi:glycerol 2-dehydrogenase (NADP+)
MTLTNIGYPEESKSAADGNAAFTRVLKPTESPTTVETYKEMEKLLETGKVKTIGVSNFSIKTFEEFLPHVKIVPAVNQVEEHPCLPQNNLNKYCQEKGIQVVGYSPLGNIFSDRGGSFN